MSEEDKIVKLMEILKNHLTNPIFFREYDEEFQKEIIESMKELGVVEKLIELVKDEDDGLSRAAIFALGQMGEKKAVKPLIQVIKNRNFNYVYAIEALGNIGDKQAIEPLLKIIKKPQKDYIEITTMYALAKLSDKSAIKPIISKLQKLGQKEDLNSKELKVLIQLVKILGSFDDEEVIKSLVDLDMNFENKSLGVMQLISKEVEASLNQILERGNDTLTYLVDQLFKREDIQYNDFHFREIRSNALKKLMERSDNPLNQLIELFRYSDSSLIISALKKLETDIVEPLLRLLKNTDNFFRANVVTTLGCLNDKRAVKPLTVILLEDNCEKIRQNAAKALGNLGDEDAVDSLVESLKDDDELVKENAIEALLELGDERVIETMITLLKSENMKIKINIIEKFRRLRDKLVVEPLIAELGDSNTHIKHRIINALGHIGDKCAVKPIIKELEEGEEQNKVEAIVALGNIGDKQAVLPLIDILKDQDERIMFYAIESLEKIGDKRALEPLKEKLDDSRDSGMKETILEAIRKIESKYPNSL